MTNEQNAPAPDADWVMVPREATSEMMNRAVEAMHAAPRDWQGRQGHAAFRAGYEAMLAAAPKPAAPREGVWDRFGGPIYFDREEAGIVIDALIEHRASAEQRKGANAASSSDYRADKCAELIGRFNAVDALTHPGHKHAQEDAAQEGWRPIVTAPKDGTHILLGRDAGAVETGFPVEVVSGYFTAHWNEWLTDGGGSMTNPTHWQPLPAPPVFTPIDSEAK